MSKEKCMSKEHGPFTWVEIPPEDREPIAQFMFSASNEQRQTFFDLMYLAEMGAFEGMSDQEVTLVVEKAMK